MKVLQKEKMRFHPGNGRPNSVVPVSPGQAATWRMFHGSKVWLFDPWTGKRRSKEDVKADPWGHQIVPIEKRTEE